MSKMLKILLGVVLSITFVYASEQTPTKEEVAKLYVATFNRAPDSAGLLWWTNSSGFTLSQIAQSFFDQDETKALYPAGTSNRDFIQSIYANLFNREPDTAGWNYWEDKLNATNNFGLNPDLSKISKNRFIEAVINGAKNTATSNDADILTNKTTVGLSFSEAGLSNKDDAKTILAGVTDDNATVDSAVTQFGISLYVIPSSTHSFQEGLSLDISSGAVAKAMIGLFKNDNSNIEMLFTLGENKTAIVQYVQNNEAIWQNTQYIYSISGNTITLNLPVGGGFNIGQLSAPMQIILTLDSSTVTAHVSATINGDAYTVFSAFGDRIEPNTSSTWTATPLTAPQFDLIISSDGKTIVGHSTDFSLHAYNIQTQATTDLTTDTNGNVLECAQNVAGDEGIVQIDESKTKYAFICVDLFGDDPLGDFANDRVYTYNLTTNTYKAISLNEHSAKSVFMNADGSKIIYQENDIDEYDVNSEITTKIKQNQSGLYLLDVDTSLNTLAYMLTYPIPGGRDHQHFVVRHNGTETIVEDLEQDAPSSVQVLDAKVSRDGTKVVYMVGNKYDSERSFLASLYMYDVTTGTKTTLAENFSTFHDAPHYEWDMSNDASTLVFIMNAPWGSENSEAPQAYIYTFDVASKTHNEIYNKSNIDNVLMSPDATAIYTSEGGYLLQLSAQ